MNKAQPSHTLFDIPNPLRKALFGCTLLIINVITTNAQKGGVKLVSEDEQTSQISS